MATTNNIYSDINKKYFGNDTSGVTTQGQTSQYDDELAQLAREGNYKSYFNNAIQSANVNKLANQYLQNNLKQSGLANTGAGTNAQTSMNNAYLNNQSDLLSQYYTDEATATEEAYDRYNTEKANEESMYETSLNSMDTQAKLDAYYNSIDKSGFSTDQLNALENAYKTASLNMSGVGTAVTSYLGSNATALDSEGLKNMQFVKSDGTSLGTGEKTVGNEINTLVANVASGKYTSPTAFRLVNANDNSTVYVIYDPESGSYYQVSKEVADKSNYDLYEIKGSGNKPKKITGEQSDNTSADQSGNEDTGETYTTSDGREKEVYTDVYGRRYYVDSAGLFSGQHKVYID